MNPPLQLSLLKGARPPVEEMALVHRQLREGAFWQHIPAYANVDEDTFLDHKWQAKHSVTSTVRLRTVLGDLITTKFLADAVEGFRRAPMSMRVSPYILSLIDWAEPYTDPLRRQFITLASDLQPDHPKLQLDSLGELEDSPVRGLTHRYFDKALFLPLDTCPVYCRFCTRSYAVGVDTEQVEKVQINVSDQRWRLAFAYIESRPEIEDVVVSGGDAYNLRAGQLRMIGNALLDIPHVRRIRIATKGIAVMPQKILTDDPWIDALTRVVEQGRKRHKEVALHTHFNHPDEITWITREATELLMERGIYVRNQSVLQRGVNDDADTMVNLVKRLSYVNVHPYYVYIHDLVKGVEDLRTTLQTALDLEKFVRGASAGYNTPAFVVDTPGGGGKRDIHSYEHYDRTSGISVYTAPSVKAGRHFMYFDPIDSLPDEGRDRWADPTQRQKMVTKAIDRARLGRRR